MFWGRWGKTTAQGAAFGSAEAVESMASLAQPKESSNHFPILNIIYAQSPIAINIQFPITELKKCPFRSFMAINGENE
jgi:hypothetical protein